MTETHAEHDAHADHVHVMPMRVLIGVLAALLILTGLTVGASWAARTGVADFGSFNIVVALAIALVKAALVALYFMHLRYDSLFNGVVLIAALVFVMLFIAVSLMDTNEYEPSRQPYEDAPRNIVEPAEAAG